METSSKKGKKYSLWLPADFYGMEQLGEILKRARKQRGFTQQDVADRTGLSTKFVSQVENGKESAEIGKVLKIIGILDLGTRLTNHGKRFR